MSAAGSERPRPKRRLTLACSRQAATQRWDPFDDPAWLFEPKYDGYRGLLYVTRKGCHFRSKRGNSSTQAVLLGARVLARTARAYRALARDDSTGAVREMEAFADTLCPECSGQRLFKARLLAAHGRDREALELLNQGFYGHQLYVSWMLERARIEERLGLREQAIKDYGLVTRFWRDPDPELLPLRDEARAALARLTSEPSS